jgi:peptide-methionine (S)-S-oxide reductase
MGLGNFVGTTYGSAVYTFGEEQARQTAGWRDAYQASLRLAGRGTITTEILPAPTFYFAEDEHQQYLAKNPYGYCNLKGTGVAYAISPA